MLGFKKFAKERYTKIGPALGSNPGGLHHDSSGKKSTSSNMKKWWADRKSIQPNKGD